MKEENKKKLSKKEIQEMKTKHLPGYMLRMIPDGEMIRKGIITGSLLNDDTNPMVMCSDDKFEKHGLCLDDDKQFLVAEAFIPYLIKSMTDMYYANLLKFYKGDATKADKHFANAFASQNIDYFDLNDTSVISEKGKELVAVQKSIEKASGELAKESLKRGLTGESMPDMSDATREEIEGKLDETRDLAEARKKSSDDAEKEEIDEQMISKLKEVEEMLTGKVQELNPKIDAQYMQKILEKHGPKAVQEELMRLEPAERDALLIELAKLKTI